MRVAIQANGLKRQKFEFPREIRVEQYHLPLEHMFQRVRYSLLSNNLVKNCSLQFSRTQKNHKKQGKLPSSTYTLAYALHNLAYACHNLAYANHILAYAGQSTSARPGHPRVCIACANHTLAYAKYRRALGQVALAYARPPRTLRVRKKPAEQTVSIGELFRLQLGMVMQCSICLVREDAKQPQRADYLVDSSKNE